MLFFLKEISEFPCFVCTPVTQFSNQPFRCCSSFKEISEFSCFVCTLVKQFRKKLPQGPDEHLTPELLGTLEMRVCTLKRFQGPKKFAGLKPAGHKHGFLFVYLFVTVTTQIGLIVNIL